MYFLWEDNKHRKNSIQYNITVERTVEKKLPVYIVVCVPVDKDTSRIAVRV